MFCPRCNAKMEPTEFGGAPVVVCAACAGTWIDAASINRLFAGEKDAIDLADSLEAMLHLDFIESRRQCPRCADRRLKAVEVANTELDYCLACKGMFFDKGELRRVYPQTSGRNATGETSAANPDATESLWQRFRRFFA